MRGARRGGGGRRGAGGQRPGGLSWAGLRGTASGPEEGRWDPTVRTSALRGGTPSLDGITRNKTGSAPHPTPAAPSSILGLQGHTTRGKAAARSLQRLPSHSCSQGGCLWALPAPTSLQGKTAGPPTLPALSSAPRGGPGKPGGGCQQHKTKQAHDVRDRRQDCSCPRGAAARAGQV